MTIIYFFYGLSFGGLGLAAYLQLRRGGDFPLRKLLPWLAAFGFVSGATGWVEMFLTSESSHVLEILRMLLYPTSGLLLLIFGWGMFARLIPLPAWMIFVPGILIVPIAYVITYALSTFVTPSPLGIPIEIWSRYLLYLPGSILAGLGFLRQWHVQHQLGYNDVASLMLGAGAAFLFEAFVVGLVVPAAPYGPASYYNYDRVTQNAFIGESAEIEQPYGLTAWLDYQHVLEATGLPIQFWRMLSAFAVTFFVMRGLDVFEAIQRRHLRTLQDERDHALQAAIETQSLARQTAENWSDTLVQIGSQIAELEDVDNILLYIVDRARKLLSSDFMGLALVENDFSHFTLKCYATKDRTELSSEPIQVENVLIRQVIETQLPHYSPLDEKPENLAGACFYTEQPAAALASVCLKLDSHTIGALWLARCENRAFSETDLIWLECLADQVVIAIKHGLMTSQLQTLSVTEERARIAREMHDGLAQVLGYLNLQVQTLEAFLQQGKLDKLQERLEQMRSAVQVAHADVRENILSLRTTLNHEKGVISGIQEYLEEFEFQTHIATHFVNGIDGEFGLASLAEVQLVCILQEALTNVRKHAHAQHVWVEINKENWTEDTRIVMLICDDGVGFSHEEQKRHFGLQTMLERSQSVSGSLHVVSTPGQGTRVECSIPCLRQEQIKKTSVILQT